MYGLVSKCKECCAEYKNNGDKKIKIKLLTIIIKEDIMKTKVMEYQKNNG